MDLGDVTSVKDFSLHHSPCSFSGKSRFIDAGQALRSASVPRLAKTEGNKIATGSPAAHICGYGGIGRLGGFRCCHLGERFFRGSSPRTFFGKSRLACFYKRGSSVTLRHGFPRRVKTEDNKIAAGIPAAHICGYGGNGRLGGFRFLCQLACGFESHYPYQNGCDIYLRINIAPVFSLPIYLSIDIFSTA